MQPDLERQLCSQAAALRALARDLVGDRDADDLLQDTALQALRSPPARAGAAGGWLGTVLRRLAFRRRRAERRRAVHEARLPPPDTAPAADAGLEHAETLRRVTAALLALPLPYRSALLLRYYEDLPPSAIAARTGEPLATVKSRLQRGLSMLRERFDAEDGDWRAAFATALGIGRATTGAAVAIAAGGIVMATGVKLSVGAVAVAAAALFWFLPPAAPPAAASQPDSRPGPLAATAAAPASQPGTAQLPAREPAPMPVDPRMASIRGRCVDVAGGALAGIRVRLTAKLRSDEVAAGAGDWSDPPPIASGSDGRFEFRFAPLPTRCFELCVGTNAHRGGYANWNRIDAGQSIELGDLPIFDELDGAQVIRVTDTARQPVAGVRVGFEWQRPRHLQSALVLGAGGGVDAATEGTCSLSRLLAGTYELTVEGREVVRGGTLEMTDPPSTAPHELVVATFAAGDVLAGVVVDEAGAPIAGATLIVTADIPGGTHADVRSDADGRFRLLRRRQDQPRPLRITVVADGCEPLPCEQPFAWGRTDLRLVLQRGAALAILALDDSGAPVEDYRAWVIADQHAGNHGDGRDWDVRSAGHHPGGVAEVQALRRGPAFVVVRADDERLQVSRPVPVAIGEPGARAVVRLRPASERRVRVQRSDGSAIAGTRVSLLDPAGGAVRAGQRRAPMPGWTWTTSNGTNENERQPILLHESITDAAGETTVRGDGDATLAVVVEGASHAPAIATAVRLTDATTLLVTVTDGARLAGSVQPEILRVLRQFADVPPAGGAGPGVQLLRGESRGDFECFPADSVLPFADDGSFAAAHVPPGRWRVVVHAPAAAMQSGTERAGEVTLREGETTQLTIDLTPAMPGELRGRVFLNGAPLASSELPRVGQLQVLVDCRDLAGQPTRAGGRLTTDADGRFCWRGRAGRATLRKSEYVVADETAVIPAGGSATQDFHFRAGILRARLVDADGAAIGGSLLELFDAGGTRLPTWTGADGRAVRELPPGHYRVLATRHDRKPLRAVPVGSCEVAAGADAEITLRLPRD